MAMSHAVAGALTMGWMVAETSALAAEDDAAVESTGVSVYAVAGVGTTAAYVPNEGPAVGPLGDISPTVGVGVYLSPKVCLEFDYAMTFTAADGYTALGFGPAVIWAFHPNVYVAGRFIVPVDPTTNLVLCPGVGGLLPLSKHVSAIAEANAMSAVARGTPDFGIGAAAGALYSF